MQDSISAQDFFEARQCATRRDRSTERDLWLMLANGVSAWPQVTQAYARLPDYFLAVEIIGSEARDNLGHVRWCLSRELLDAAAFAAARFELGSERLLPLDAVLVRRCLACGAASLVAGRNQCGTDAAGDPWAVTELFTLCLHEPHAHLFTASRSWQWLDALR